MCVRGGGGVVSCKFYVPFKMYLQECQIPTTAQDKQFSYWYSSDVILTNVRKVISEVAVVVEEVVPRASSSSSDTSSSISPDSSPDDIVTHDVASLPTSYQIAPSIVTGKVMKYNCNLS